MKILAIETSSAAASVAVANDGTIIVARSFEAPRGRGAEVFSLLDELRPTWNGLDRIAIGIGPGSYNGLRVACAVAGSFELALGIAIVTAPSPCLLDTDAPHYFATGDARGGRVYWAEVRERKLCGEVSLLVHAEMLEKARAASAPVYRVGPLAGADHLPAAQPSAEVLARIAPSLPAADPRHLEPIYLKPPHITTPRADRP